MPLPEIIYEDNHLIAAVKRSGQTVQPEPGKPPSLEEEVKNYIKHTYKKPGEVFLGVIHRLDMPVSGIVLFSKTSKALARMNEAFQQREISKMYLAKVENHPPQASALITHFLKRDENKNYTKAFVTETRNAQEARLKYKVVGSNRQFSVLAIELLTGRKHQIRAQLSAIGCPIAGDVKYGAVRPFTGEGICLHATELTFTHPVKNERVNLVSAPPPWAELHHS